MGALFVRSKGLSFVMSGLPARSIRLFTGNSCRDLSDRIATYLDLSLSAAEVTNFANGETNVKIKSSIRGDDVYIIQSVCSPSPNDFLMEMLIMVDAMKRGSAGRVTVVIPHFGYARQDKKDKARAPITAKLVANLLQTSGVDRVITMDLHASQIQGFFDIPVDNLYGEPIFARYVREHLRDKLQAKQIVVVSPDAGGVKRTKAFSDLLSCPIAIIHKERKKANEVDAMTLVGSVDNMVVLLVDDMIDTCGTVVLASETCMAGGAVEVWAIATHGVLSDPAIQRISQSEALKGVIIANSIPHHPDKLAQAGGKIVTLDISTLLAEAIRRTHNGESISALFGPSFAAETTIVN